MTTRTRRRVAAPTPELPRGATHEVRIDGVFETLLADANSDIRVLAANLSRWADEFKADPARAFEWSQNQFRDAARLKLARLVIARLTTDTDPYTGNDHARKLRALRAGLREMVLRAAKYPERSTSPQSNDMSLHSMAATAEWLEKVERRIEYNKVSLES